jgi:DNA helicase IV
MVARHLAKNLTVFADENQRLTNDNSTLQAIGRRAGIKERHELRRNYRNTFEIGALAAEFCTGLSTGVPDLPERRGDKPRVVPCDGLHVAVDFIARFERNHTDHEIGVLVPTAKLQKQFVNRLEPKTSNAIQVYYGGKGKAADVLDFDSPGIKIVNYRSAKGLEFDTVFLPELQTVTEDPSSSEFKMKFYVLVSRARDELFLLYSGDEPRMIQALPRDLLEWP